MRTDRCRVCGCSPAERCVLHWKATGPGRRPNDPLRHFERFHVPAETCEMVVDVCSRCVARGHEPSPSDRQLAELARIKARHGDASFAGTTLSGAIIIAVGSNRVEIAR